MLMKTLREQFEPQLAQLNAQLAPLRQRFEALQPREQLAVAAAGLVLVLAMIYWVLWQPFALWRAHAESSLHSGRELAARIEIIGAQAQAAHPMGNAMAGAGMSLLTVVDQASKDGTLGKPPSRIQPDGDKQVRVWVEDVQFDSLLRWLDSLQSRYGLHIDGVAVERRPTAGTVNARLTLMRAS